MLEAWGGIEPPNIPFAEECLTTWLPGPILKTCFPPNPLLYKERVPLLGRVRCYYILLFS